MFSELQIFPKCWVHVLTPQTVPCTFFFRCPFAKNNENVYMSCHTVFHSCIYTVQQALRVQWRVFGVFVCFDLYFVNYRTWQAEILQERAEGCIQVDLQKKIRQD